MPKLNTTLFWTPKFEWYVGRCGSQNWHPKRHHMFEGDWTKCSKYVEHSKLNSQHDWEDLYDQLLSTGIFTLIMNKIFI